MSRNQRHRRRDRRSTPARSASRSRRRRLAPLVIPNEVRDRPGARGITTASSRPKTRRFAAQTLVASSTRLRQVRWRSPAGRGKCCRQEGRTIPLRKRPMSEPRSGEFLVATKRRWCAPPATPRLRQANDHRCLSTSHPKYRVVASCSTSATLERFAAT